MQLWDRNWSSAISSPRVQSSIRRLGGVERAQEVEPQLTHRLGIILTQFGDLAQALARFLMRVGLLVDIPPFR
ncbi:MAG: hypothetical protein HY735_00325 [Verrucomicrobia bacterium]|nr:hypothetical protein [Verrucomicrobiota bacterium]